MLGLIGDALQGKFMLTVESEGSNHAFASGDGLQGAAADCNSAGETHAWFDSRVAHHLSTGIGNTRDGMASLVDMR